MFWLYFWFLLATILPPVYSIEHNTFCPAQCTCETKEAEVLRLHVQCHNLTLSEAPTSANSSLVYSLDLSFNKILVLYSYVFQAYDNVAILLLTNSKIANINARAFHSLQHLECIDLSYNAFVSIPPKLFIQNRKLQRVSLRNNLLVTLQADFPILIISSLLHLDLSNCKLSDLSPISLSQLPNLQSLDLSGNSLRELSANALLPLSQLEIINLSKNPWRCSAEFERIVCLQYKISNVRSHNMTCFWMNGRTKTYSSLDQEELCRGLTTTNASFTTVASNAAALIDVSTDMRNRSYGNAFQGNSTTSLFTSEPNSTSNEDSTSEEKNMGDRSTDCTQSHIMTRNMWRTAGIGRPSTEFTGALLDAREVTSDIKNDKPSALTTNPPTSLSIITTPPLPPDIQTEVFDEDEPLAAAERETGGWDNFLPSDSNTVPVYVILLVFVAVIFLIAACCFKKKMKTCMHHEIEGKDNNLAASGTGLPLLDPHLTADLRKPHQEYVSGNSQRIYCDKDHVYE